MNLKRVFKSKFDNIAGIVRGVIIYNHIHKIAFRYLKTFSQSLSTVRDIPLPLPLLTEVSKAGEALASYADGLLARHAISPPQRLEGGVA